METKKIDFFSLKNHNAVKFVYFYFKFESSTAEMKYFQEKNRGSVCGSKKIFNQTFKENQFLDWNYSWFCNQLFQVLIEIYNGN